MSGQGSKMDVAQSRRGFLKRAGGMGAAALALPAAGCAAVGRINSHTLDFSSDFGVLNYAYSLEVMESDFYNRVVASPPRGLRPEELALLRDIQQHEMVHRRFFARALGPLKIDVPERDFSSVDFTSRDQVLTISRTFEDTGTAAYNGAGKLLSLAEFLSIAGKIVSVEARQAAALRDLTMNDPRAFAGDDIIDENGMERALDPPEVIDRVQRFFRERFRITGLPGRMS